MTSPGSPKPISASRARSRGKVSEFSDNAGAMGDLVMLIWQRKLWWLVPLVIALLILAGLLTLTATPIGPLLYPVF